MNRRSRFDREGQMATFERADDGVKLILEDAETQREVTFYVRRDTTTDFLYDFLRSAGIGVATATAMSDALGMELNEKAST